VSHRVRRPVLSVAFAAAFALGAAAARAQQALAAPVEPNVVFLHWNDFHGQFRPQPATSKERGPDGALPQVGGAAAMATFVQRQRAAAAARGIRVVVTDGGDWFQGTIEGNETHGRLALELFARLGVEATVLGNHEYDFGADLVKLLCAAARFPVLGANIAVARAEPRQAVDYVRPFCTVLVHGLRVVFVGLIAADTKAVSTGPWGEAEFEDEAEALARVLPAAQAAGDAIVLLSHAGLEKDRALARRFPEVALILGAHSHEGLREPIVDPVTGTWIVQTHGKGSEIYRIEARADAPAKTLALLRGELVELDHERHPPDPATAAWITAETRDLAAHWDQVIGELATDLGDSRGPGSSAAGNLVCDAFLAATGADLALTNKGGLRARLAKGPLTRRMVYELLPFDNELVSLDLTGAQLRALLAAAVAGDGRPLEIGGGSYRVVVRDGERAVDAITVGTAPLDEAKVYRVATNSFLARGGDGLAGFVAGTNRTGHGLLLRDALLRQAERDGRLVADETNRIRRD
jgi:2',3'-cyclic-nucleotide 2'-phosphodiesterase (5'-nucleotidase family)